MNYLEITKNYQKQNNLRCTPDLFFNLERAKSALKHYVKAHFIVMADCGHYLVVCLSDAQKLINNGYEAI